MTSADGIQGGMTPSVRHGLVNLVQSGLLLLAMVAIVWAVARASLGPESWLWALLMAGAVLALAPVAPKDFVLRLYRARPLAPAEFPFGVAVLEALAGRAGLPKPPRLYYVPSTVPNAFAVGSTADSAVAVTDGLLRLLDRRELVGVLAHEVSHIAHRDLWIMGLADLMARVTGVLSMAGLLLLVINLPLAVLGYGQVSWLAILVLIVAPFAMALAQMALSRTREFDADRGAVRLTGDGTALASALMKLDRLSRHWARRFAPRGLRAEPCLLRTHPPTAERIRRISQIATQGQQPIPPAETAIRVPAVATRPRWHRTGAWY